MADMLIVEVRVVEQANMIRMNLGMYGKRTCQVERRQGRRSAHGFGFRGKRQGAPKLALVFREG
jgi:hypothetical protein